MKSAELHTIYDVIVTDYRITPLPNGRAHHCFHPATTNTLYEFEANNTPVVVEGERYNIGFTVTAAGKNLIDQSALSPSSKVNPTLSYLFAQKLAEEKFQEEKAKNDTRVIHNATDGEYYWGKKYAWRMFGACIARDAFDSYLDEIGHPSTPCITRDPAKPYSNDQSVAYAETGLADAIENLISSAVKVGRHYKSPLYSRQFTIKGINAITFKK